MYIQNVNIQNFRNYENINLELSKGINILTGDNAQGKTNLLEAIYICSTARSHRTNHEKQVIRWEQQGAYVSLDIKKNFLEDQINFCITNKGKSVAINKIPITKLDELFGVLNTVIFSPEDLQLIKKSPKERRRFIDIEMCQVDKVYYYLLRQYYKVLKQRNNYLKQNFGKIDNNMLDTWDLQLEKFAVELIKKRKLFIHTLNNIASKIHYDLSNKTEHLEIIYDYSVDDKEFLEKLSRARRRDLATQTTYVGPHKDDLKFVINGVDAKLYASQGQQRSIVLSIKLSEVELIRETKQESPVLLLDDVLSELDIYRQEYLLTYTKDIQTIITCTGIEQSVWKSLEIGKLYRVIDGTIIT
ncbi:MAG: DNA replication protein RecF [Epulopiscium sp. Nele67-Bin004]|nr:MAG: DNA replication protein RecF [Epulopiscium sp. Nele67-Bin004]